MREAVRLMICPEGEADLYAYRRTREGATIRIIRGRRCAVMDRCMAEWAAAMQFPYIFDGTWESFAQCLRDVHLAPGGKLVILITNLDRVLPRAAADFAQLFQALSDFDAKLPASGGPASLELVLHAQGASAEQVEKRLSAAGIEYRLIGSAGPLK
jgi:hypothetical protein